jgi:3D (Asp-Asp-Asp) domain-containing protein/septal ring factor EnvC (AmiA/AmiB activator)
VGASRQRRAARIAAAGLAALGALVLGAVARAENPSSNAAALRTENASLQARSHRALLELYALESRLVRAEQRVEALERRAAELAEREASARRQLAQARADLDEAERRLEARLRALYIAGEPDPLAVLLGSASLDAVISTFEGLDRTARQDRGIVSQLFRARRTLKAALRDVRARRAELDRSLAGARDARASLVAARAERAGYLMSLARRRELNNRQIAQLTSQAAAASSQTVSSAGGGTTVVSAPAATPPAAPAEGGRVLTVSSTGYCLQGTTATGIPVGWGVVAVDPAVIPLGTRMTIPGYGEGVAADTGSSVVGATIDLWFPSCAQALTWGRRTVTITLH